MPKLRVSDASNQQAAASKQVMQERESAGWDFEELEVFKRAYALSLEMHRASLGFPPIEQRALADQLRRASKSSCANLAEGFGRRGVSPGDFGRFARIAIGSADELRVWARFCLDLGYIDDATWRRWRGEAIEIARNAPRLGARRRRQAAFLTVCCLLIAGN